MTVIVVVTSEVTVPVRWIMIVCAPRPSGFRSTTKPSATDRLAIDGDRCRDSLVGGDSTRPQVGLGGAVALKGAALALTVRPIEPSDCLPGAGQLEAGLAGEGLDVVRGHVVATRQKRVAAGCADERDRGAGAGAQLEERGQPQAVCGGISRGPNEVDHVFLDGRRDADGCGQTAKMKHVGRAEERGLVAGPGIGVGRFGVP